MKINWWALLQVGAVTVFAAVAIAALMNAANWCFTARDDAETRPASNEPSLRSVFTNQPLRNVAVSLERSLLAVISLEMTRRVLGFVLMGITCLLVLFGLYLMIPYFR